VTQTFGSTRAEDRQVSGDVDHSDTIKRRLGSLTAPASADATVPLRDTAARATMPIGHSDFVPTSKLASGGAATREMTTPDATRPMVEPHTVPLTSNGGTTSSLDSFMAELTGTAPMTMPGDATVALTTASGAPTVDLSSEIDELRRRAHADPSNPDLVFELALALNEAGERSEANQHLQSLVSIYEARGESEQAARIMSMIGDIVTQPFASDTAQTAVIGRNTTESLGARAGTMSLRGVRRDGRVGGRKADQRERPVFSMRDIGFIEPLPQAERLGGDAAWFFAKAEKERARGRHWLALDWIQMTAAADPTVPAIYFRMAELQLKTGLRQPALETINRLESASVALPTEIPDWAFARIRLHAEPFELTKVNRLVDQLIAEGHGEVAAPYAARLVEHLALEERLEEAQSYSDKIRSLAPGDSRATLEAAILSIRMANPRDAVERWEHAVRNGADATVAKASLAAILATDNEAEHWRLLSTAMPVYRESFDSLIADAYRRTAEACGWTPVHKAVASLFYGKTADTAARLALANAAGDRAGSPIARAAASAALVRILGSGPKGDEYLSAIRTTLSLFSDTRVPAKTNWLALVGYEPSIADMSFELGKELIRAGDAAGAVEVLKHGHSLRKDNPAVAQALADAYVKTNQLGSALSVLDELAMTHRKAGQLEEMAALLRQMSQLAPSNTKVKTRLIDAYLQRGFVAEARAELIQRADLEERSGKKKESIVSLQRAADLSWNLGLQQESFTLYDRILAIDPEDVANRSALVNLYLQVGRLSEAAEHQRAVVDLALKYGRKHEAVAALHQVIGLTPDDVTAYYQLGETLSSMGEYQQAEKVYRRITLMSPEDAVAQAKAMAMAALREQASD
jgi:thioredoxin-like negative regulator of GroEL